jgi:thioredoxin-like negative regulator of GroEL
MPKHARHCEENGGGRFMNRPYIFSCRERPPCRSGAQRKFRRGDFITENRSKTGYPIVKETKGAITMLDLNEKLYEEFLTGDKPVLVEYWAPWCVYCRRIVVAMEQVAKNHEGRLVVGRINIDDFPALADRERIEVVPTLVLYHKGDALGSMVAPESRSRIEEFLEDYLEN